MTDKQQGAKTEAQGVCTCPSGDGSLRWPCPSHPASHDAQQPDYSDSPTAREAAARELLAAGWKWEHNKWQQPAVVGDGVHSLPAEWRATAARHRSRGTGQSVAQANGYDMAANMLEAALTPAATPGEQKGDGDV